MELSYWEKDIYNNSDFCIVGAGLVGHITALELKKKYPSSKILLVERGSLPSGASTKNEGFACFGSVSEIEKDMAVNGEEAVEKLIRLRWEGLDKLRQLIANDEAIGLHFPGSHELFLADQKEYADSLIAELGKFNTLVENAIGEKNVYQKTSNKFGFNALSDLLFNRLEGQLHTGLLMDFLGQKIRQAGIQTLYNFGLREYSKQGNTISLLFENTVEFQTSNLVFATNAFTKEFFPDLDIVAYRNQVIATEEIPDLKIKGTFHYNAGFGYFRNIGNRLILGGFRDIDMLGEKTKDFGTSTTIQAHLEWFLYNILGVDSSIKITDRWSGILATGLEKSPIVKEVEPNVYVGVRLGGMGIAIGSLTAAKLAELT